MLKIIEDLDVYAYRKGWSKSLCILIPIFYPTTWPIIIYRFGSWVVKLKISIFRLPLYVIYFFLKRLTEILTTIEISEYAEIGGGFYIAHIGNIIIAHHTKIGKYASMHQGVTIGVDGSSDKLPVIGDRVYFGAGAKIFGQITLGDGVVIGANAVINRDAQDNATIVGIPGKIINYSGSEKFVHYRGK